MRDDRRCGVEIRGLYDGVAYWSIPGYNWHRWPKGHYVRERLEKWAAQHGVAIHDVSPNGLECEP